MHTLSIAGHAWRRNLFVTDSNGIDHSPFQQWCSPGGAALVGQILLRSGAAGITPPSLDGFQQQYLPIRKTKDAQGACRYLAAPCMGWADGERILPPTPADFTAVLDAGQGGLDDLQAAQGPCLWASEHALPPLSILAREGLHLMLDVSVLRKNGALISKQISWERTAMELVWQLVNNPRFASLKRSRNLLVTFGSDAIAHIRRDGPAMTARLALAHGLAEGIATERLAGEMPDAFPAMVAAAVRGLLTGDGLCYEAVMQAGHAPLASGFLPQALQDGTWFALPDVGAGCRRIAFDIPNPAGSHVADPEYWCITDAYTQNKLYQLSKEIVTRGLDAIDGLPHVQFGDLTTIDRREIESFQNARNLITDYIASGNKKPLSIAVFGAPGSGKSFGVTQIAKNIAPDLVKKMEFNVSQFRGPEDLSAALHQVRDAVLVGSMPLVFFDEFDSDYSGRALGWLKSFLMPMQDGEFKDGSGQHPIGRCIFVFAGGTSASFEAFSRPIAPEATLQEREAFRQVKGPDFVSRLRGSINIMGPNRVDANDHNYLLRRAILLSSFSRRKLDTKRPDFIDRDVLRTMLVIPEYKHGARSMEAIFDMSRLQGNALRPVSLPFRTQLSLHVDADAFINLVLRDTILGSYTEKLAIAIHNDFCRKNPGHAMNRDWEALDELIRDSNRRQAATYPEKLSAVGLGFDTGESPFETVDSFTPEQREALAVLEHDSWVEQRLAHEWTYAPIKNDKKKQSPYLVPWDQLSPEVKQYDYDTVDNILPLMQSVNLRVYRAL